jgi:hypothetical protein
MSQVELLRAGLLTNRNASCCPGLQVMAAVVQVHQDISKASNRLKRHTDSWKKYSDIWKADRISLLDKFKAKAPPTPAFEEKFAKFQKVCPCCFQAAVLSNLVCMLCHETAVGLMPVHRTGHRTVPIELLLKGKQQSRRRNGPATSSRNNAWLTCVARV